MLVEQSPNRVGENLYSSLLSDSKGLTAHPTLSDSSSTISDLLAHYEEEMTNFIYAIPHIPPTNFELKVRHENVKKKTLRMYDLCQNGDASMRQQLDSQLDTRFASVLMKNMHEYKACQTGFIIGWKCNVNKPSHRNCRNQSIDDRF